MIPSFLPRLLKWGAAGLLLLSLLLSVPAQADETIVDWRFGVIEAYEAPEAAAELGVAWTRVQFQWAEVQAGGPDSWEPAVSADQLAAEQTAGRLVVGLLIGIPDWARDENQLPRGLWLPPDDPENSWAVFVRQAVSQYQGQIDHWVIWNEPDIWDTETPGHTWDGTVEDFAQLQRTAYLVAKESNPQAVIHLAAMTYFWDANYGREQYLNRLLDVIVADPRAADHNYYFDALTAHLYFQPNTIYDLVQLFYRLVADHGIPWKPLWLMETNAPPLDDPAWPVPNWTLSVTQAEQAAFMPQALASALAAGAQRIGVYKLQDTAGDRLANPEPFGLLRLDGSRRPAYTTYSVAIRQMTGMTGVVRERWDAVGQIRLAQGDRTTTVLFSRLPFHNDAEVVATAETAWLIDMWGERQLISAQDGLFRLTLPPALCSQSIGDYCMIGGETYYLVQSTGGEAPPEGLPAPVLPTVTPTFTPTPSDTPAPTATPLPTVTPSFTPPPAATETPTAVRPTAEPSATATWTPQPSPAAGTETGEEDGRFPFPVLMIGAGLLLIAVLGMGWWLRSRR